MKTYIHQHKDWTQFYWDEQIISFRLAELRNLQGRLLGQMTYIGFDLQQDAKLDNLTLDIIKSSEIEGVTLDREEVRSSIARQLGINKGGLVSSSRDIDAIAEVTLDATQNYKKELTEERLFGWHNALFTTGYSGSYKITVAAYRQGEIQVVSGGYGKEKVHFEAVEHDHIQSEMDKFLHWFNNESLLIDNIIKAAIAHFLFVTIHPFEDGNGRLARVISDLLLARSDESPQRFYSMSAQINLERKAYYEILERSQKQNHSDITNWLIWFLDCLSKSILASELRLRRIMQKANFWTQHAGIIFNERQIKILNMLLDGDFFGKLRTSKWAKITKSSQDTALRDINDLINKGVLIKESEGGRSTHYRLADE